MLGRRKTNSAGGASRYVGNRSEGGEVADDLDLSSRWIFRRYGWQHYYTLLVALRNWRGLLVKGLA